MRAKIKETKKAVNVLCIDFKNERVEIRHEDNYSEWVDIEKVKFIEGLFDPKKGDKVVKYIMRVLVFPFMTIVILISTVVSFFRSIISFVIYGGEVLIYDRKLYPATFYHLLKKQ